MNVPGFKGSAVAAGIKYASRLDLGLIVSERPALVAGVFTTNEVKAAPVLLDMERLGNDEPRKAGAIIVNSGNANACTGPQGLADAREMCELVAAALDFSPEEVLVASTGVIGAPMPMGRIRAAVPALAAGLHSHGLDEVSHAILTTDRCPKSAVRAAKIEGRLLTLGGIAKGAGMIGPRMGPRQATMLAFVFTDAEVDPMWWQGALNRATEASFNRIVIDGDTSTNDTVLAMANGMAANVPVSFPSVDATVLENALAELLQDLARQIVMDGEGATKHVTVTVCGARTTEDADRIARTIAGSPLVKTAFFGEDPNWGRILAAAGRAGVSLSPMHLSLNVNDTPIVRRGQGLGEEAEALAREAMRQGEFTVTLDLGLGRASAQILTCDLSVEYVRINADYRT